MRFKIKPESIWEWIALKLNLAPTPLVDTQVAFNSARTIMAGASLGIYEAMGKHAMTAEEISTHCGTHQNSTKKLLDALVSLGYLKFNSGKYSLVPRYYKWLLREFDSNLIGKLRFQSLEWNWMGGLEEFVKTGKSINVHETATEDEWELYQEGMRDLSVNAAKELAKKIPLPKEANQILDIGGSHGLFSIELCKRHPGLKSTIMELPGAVESARAISKRYDNTGRVSYQPGNALLDDLGENKYDLVMINNVVHHFSFEANKSLAVKVAKALKPGGIFAIGEFIRTETPGEGGVVGSTTGLYFALTSLSGSWSRKEIEAWQSSANLRHLTVLSARSMPGWQMVVAQKS